MLNPVPFTEIEKDVPSDNEFVLTPERVGVLDEE